MITSKEILDLVAAYTDTKDLDAFSASFAGVFYDIEENGDEAAIQLAYKIEALLASATAGLASESSLFDALCDLSPSVAFIVCAPEITNQDIATYGFFTKAHSLFTNWEKAAETVKVAYVGIAPSVGFGSVTSAPSTLQTNTGLPPWQLVIRAQ
jgi:hypothetical protein